MTESRNGPVCHAKNLISWIDRPIPDNLLVLIRLFPTLEVNSVQSSTRSDLLSVPGHSTSTRVKAHRASIMSTQSYSSRSHPIPITNSRSLSSSPSSSSEQSLPPSSSSSAFSSSNSNLIRKYNRTDPSYNHSNRLSYTQSSVTHVNLTRNLPYLTSLGSEKGFVFNEEVLLNSRGFDHEMGVMMCPRRLREELGRKEVLVDEIHLDDDVWGDWDE
ncbi:hypothetical protein DFS34DRAFT_516171 [Phlyctochytrium arcticum]|nr:hypothetical protein DFS34DRAFT_516171 [Phlyctochytrium arcticum]